MGKAPASQFYWGDLRRDTEYHLMSFEARGIWIEMLTCMHFSSERGKLEGTPEQYARLLGCSIEEFERARLEISVTKTGDVTNGNGIVTIINRRMFREERERKLTRSRVQKFRNAKSNATCNASVTETSSSSSPKENIIKENFGEFNNVKLTKEEHEKLLKSFGDQGTKDRIENLSQYIASKGKKYSSHYATILNWERKHLKDAKPAW